MLTPTLDILRDAQENKYAIGAFNVYNLEGICAVINAAESELSPVILQIHPAALDFGGTPLIGACIEAANSTRVSVGVHLDHCSSKTMINNLLEFGIKSVMADGSKFSYNENLEWTKSIVNKAHTYGAVVEAELGRISGTEDGITVEEFQAKFTDPDEAYEFVNETSIDSLAVCIGNVHGKYPGIPNLDFQLLKEIRKKVDLPLILHGASGLPPKLVRKSIQLGVCKFNVNTEVREAYLNFFDEYPKDSYSSSDLLEIMKGVTDAMMEIVVEKIKLFGSSSRS